MKRNIFVFLTLICTLTCNKVLPVLHKCCPNDQLVTGRNNKCINSTEPLDFSQILIINQEFEQTDKKINDSFVIVADRFQDRKFRNKSINSLIFRDEDINMYLNEKAILCMEMVNVYDRWIKFNPDEFCIDFYKSQGFGVKLAFWMQKEMFIEESDDHDHLSTNEAFISHTKARFSILRNSEVAYAVTFYVLMISCCFLLTVLIVYASLPELRNLSGLLLMSFVVNMLVALLERGVIMRKRFDGDSCFKITLSIYFFALASFCWMNVMAFDVWWILRNTKARPNYQRPEILTYAMYSLYAWSIPLAMTIMFAWISSMDLTDKPWFIKPIHSFSACFISGGEKFLYLDVPLLILICINWIFHGMTAFNIRATPVLDPLLGDTHNITTHRKRFHLYLKLTIMMTINCILRAMKFIVPDIRTWYLNVTSNTLIGISVFLIFIYKRKIIGRFCR